MLAFAMSGKEDLDRQKAQFTIVAGVFSGRQILHARALWKLQLPERLENVDISSDGEKGLAWSKRFLSISQVKLSFLQSSHVCEAGYPLCMYVCKTLFQYANFDNYLQLVSTKGVYTQRAKC